MGGRPQWVPSGASDASAAPPLLLLSWPCWTLRVCDVRQFDLTTAGSERRSTAATHLCSSSPALCEDRSPSDRSTLPRFPAFPVSRLERGRHESRAAATARASVRGEAAALEEKGGCSRTASRGEARGLEGLRACECLPEPRRAPRASAPHQECSGGESPSLSPGAAARRALICGLGASRPLSPTWRAQRLPVHPLLYRQQASTNLGQAGARRAPDRARARPWHGPTSREVEMSSTATQRSDPEARQRAHCGRPARARGSLLQS